MSERFEVPEPSPEAVKVGCDAWLDNMASEWEVANTEQLKAAYAIDLPAIVRAEVGRFGEHMRAQGYDGWMASGSEYATWGTKAHRAYLASRFGAPEEGQCPTCEGLCRVVLGEPHRLSPTPSAPAETCGYGPACPMGLGARPEEKVETVHASSGSMMFTQCTACSQWYGGAEHTCERVWMLPAERDFLRALAVERTDRADFTIVPAIPLPDPVLAAARRVLATQEDK